MTAIVGILCSDGAVIGTDSSTTSVAAGGFRTIEQPTDKLYVFKEQIIIAGTGNVGHGQRFRHIVEEAWDQRLFTEMREGSQPSRKPVEVCHHLSKEACQNFAETKSTDVYGALIAFPLRDAPVLCEFSQLFQPELKTEQMWFCSMGSTQTITDPFLALMRDIFWTNCQPTVREAVIAVTWALDHVIAVNPGGVNGPARIAVLERDEGKCQARLLPDEELEGPRSWIEDTKKQLSKSLQEKIGVEAPPKLQKIK